MTANVRVIAGVDGADFVLAVDSHPEQIYVTVGMTREALAQLGAEIHRYLTAPLSGKDSP